MLPPEADFADNARVLPIGSVAELCEIVTPESDALLALPELALLLSAPNAEVCVLAFRLVCAALYVFAVDVSTTGFAVSFDKYEI